MGISLSAITGAAQTGFTSPTYTPTLGTAPDANGKQYAVTAVGGTQTGVNVHTVSNPFTIAFWIPKVLKMVGRLNANGVLVQNPKNTYWVITRKGVTPLAGQAYETMVVKTEISVPAGAESYDAANVKAALSAHFGAEAQVSAAIGGLVQDAVL